MIQRGDIRYKTPLLTINAPVSILTKLQDEMLMHRNEKAAILITSC